ncbi:MAG TPA: DUF4255 domain-containing protein [Candidatus Acidoferrales bacterium]|nr:DUF4255 domain-containing protein [Candidatus Acidoferrales bacterium]
MSYNNLSSTSKTLANLIWNAIKDDKELNQIVKNIEQISFAAPNEADKAAQLSVFLYGSNELPAMRNQPPKANEPKPLLYLKLHYLITPLTHKPLTDQVLLGKIIRIFAEKPIVRGSDLKESLADSQSELRISFDNQSIEDQNRIWMMLQTPYKLSASYSVYPVEIKTDTPKPKVSSKNTTVAAAAAAKLA